MAEDRRARTRADLAPGGMRCLDDLIVVCGQDGRYHAIARQCSHQALPLDGGRVRGSSIVCPHHGARFDLDSGKALGPPAYAPIATYPLLEEDGMVEVLVGA